jgi:hypothetical protein
LIRPILTLDASGWQKSAVALFQTEMKRPMVIHQWAGVPSHHLGDPIHAEG